MNARLRMYKYCYSNEGAIYAKGLCSCSFHIYILISSNLVFVFKLVLLPYATLTLKKGEVSTD